MSKDELISFLEKNLLRGRGRIDPAESLIDRGILDSIGLMRILEFVEGRIGMRIPGDRVTPDNFQSVEAITALVERLRDSSARRPSMAEDGTRP
jgi:acyl carrier protein